MNWTQIGKYAREIDWGFRQTGRSIGQFTILCLALVLLLAPTGLMLAIGAGIGFCFSKMFGGGYTTMGLTFIAAAALMVRYIGPVVQPKVKIAVMALVAPDPPPKR